MPAPTLETLMGSLIPKATPIRSIGAWFASAHQHGTQSMPIPRDVKNTLKTLAYQSTHAMRSTSTASVDDAARVLASLLISRELAAGGRHHEHSLVIAAGVAAATASVHRAARHAAAGAFTRGEHAAVIAALSAFEQQLDDKTLSAIEFDVARGRVERTAIHTPIN